MYKIQLRYKHLYSLLFFYVLVCLFGEKMQNINICDLAKKDYHMIDFGLSKDYILFYNNSIYRQSSQDINIYQILKRGDNKAKQPDN